MLHTTPESSPQNQSMFALTKVWFGFLFFAVVVNVVPYLPSFNEALSDQEFVVQYEHSAFCAPQSWVDSYPENVQEGGSEFIALTSAPTKKLQSEKEDCVLPLIYILSPSVNGKKRLARFSRASILPVHLHTHPVRGPPKV